MQKRILCYVIACLFSLDVLSQYIYEANQSLIDLTNQSGTTSLNAADDQVSSVFNLGFTFDFYGSGFTQARIATNGCLHFKITGAYCNDFTPDPLASQYTYTLLPFWTDLIQDNDSKMLAKAFSDKTVFGWYDMREYNRASDNSFEVILWTNDTFEFRYGALDIINHDVLIGEVGSGSKQFYQYYYHDECNTGSTNASNCVNTNWNDTSTNNLLESGGSLFGVGTGNALDCSSALNDVNCAGYAAAYLTQQCDIDSLYSDECTGYAGAYLTQQCDITQLYDTTCPSYWNAYDAQQCEDDEQYSPSCPGYQQNESVAYYVEEDDYGYTEEDLWYDEEYDEYLDPNDPCYENRCEGFTDADWYELDVEQFGQEQVDDWMGSDIIFSDDGMIDFETTLITSYDDVDVMMDLYDTEQEEIRVAEDLAWEEEQQRYEEEILREELFLFEEEIYAVELQNTEEEHIDYLEEFAVVDEFTNNQRNVIDILDAEELIELYEFDTIIREELDYEEEIFAIREEVEELEEEMEELREEEEELFELEEETEERLAKTEHEEESEQKKERSSVRINALDVVAGTLRSARESVTDSGGETSTTVASVSNSTAVATSSNNNFTFEDISSTSVSDSISSFNAGSSVSFSGVVNYGSTTLSSTSNVSNSSVISSSSSSGGGISTSSSPSRSDQFASASVQTNQVLDMSSMSIFDASSSSTLDNTTSVDNATSVNNTASVSDTTNVSVSIVSVDTVTSTVQSQIDTSINAMDTSSDTETVVEDLIAQNLQTAQEEVEAEQEETGEYGSENTIIAYMSFVPGFNNYTQVVLVDQDQWYASKTIYITTMSDNLEAFYGLASSNISKMSDIIELQPKL